LFIHPLFKDNTLLDDDRGGARVVINHQPSRRFAGWDCSFCLTTSANKS
jgi:hypothetical protein